MPTSYPDRDTLIGAVVDFLDGELYARLTGADRYRCRVAINALRIVQRELSLGEALDAAEVADLQALNAPSNLALADDIEQGRIGLNDPALVAYLERSTGRALQINNPKWLDQPSPG